MELSGALFNNEKIAHESDVRLEELIRWCLIFRRI